jgi:FAD/FMN-containing dehydrogenase
MPASLKSAAPAAEWLDRLAAVVGPAHAVREAVAMTPWLVEPRDMFHGRAALVLRPGSTAEISRLLAIANEGRVPIVAQSGNTGLVGGQTPSPAGDQVVLSLDRLDRIREVDATDNTLTVDAGVTLEGGAGGGRREAGRLFPLSLAAEGTCAESAATSPPTPAASTRLAFGNARDLVLGLEVVLADGRVWNGLRRLRKDNTGYDLKHLFIGAEGTLGIITAAVLKLFPAPRARATAWVGVASPQAGLDLLDLARERAPGTVTAIELVSRIGLEFTLRHAATRDPLESPFEWYVLLEMSGTGEESVLTEGLEAVLADGLERGILGDAVQSPGPARRPPTCGASARPCRRCSATKAARSSTMSRCPCRVSPPSSSRGERGSRPVIVAGARPVAFGHIGDGNIHFNVSQPPGADKADFLARWEEVAASVHEIVLRLGGSVSAEHGIGQLKRHLLPAIKSPVELASDARSSSVCSTPTTSSIQANCCRRRHDDHPRLSLR